MAVENEIWFNKGDSVQIVIVIEVYQNIIVIRIICYDINNMNMQNNYN